MLQSELAVLRKKLDSDRHGHHDVLTRQTTQLGDRHVSSHLGSTPAFQLPLRTMLQADSDPDWHCSITELLNVQADTVAALTALFVTNLGCAMCLVACSSSEWKSDAAVCAMGCLKQDEGVCTAEDLLAIEATGMPSSLTDRAQLVRILEVSTRACVRCILETVASVCGIDCASERLHLATDYAYSPRPCLPQLAARISVGETSAFQRAVAANQPFGLTIGAQLSSPAVGDLFVPSAGTHQPHKIYRGVDSGMLAYQCDPAVHGSVWALLAAPSANDAAVNVSSPAAAMSMSIDIERWANCSSTLRIDLQSGQAYSQPGSIGSSGVPIRFDLNWARCSTFLPFLDDIGPATDPKTLDGGTSMAASCWLSRFFGPQTHRKRPFNYTLELLDASLTLESDLVVRSGTTLRLTSTRTTVIVGSHQIRVESGARLELDGLTLADSVQSSALVVAGSATASRTTFFRCNAETNVILSGAMDITMAVSFPNGDGAFLAAVGAALQIVPSASMEIVDSALLECSVGGAKIASCGGAIFVHSKAQLVVLRSELRRNSVEGGFYCAGGALALHVGANATIRDSVIGENIARNSTIMTLGGAVYLQLTAEMVLHKTEVCHNLAAGGNGYVLGGGFYVYASSRLAISESLLCHNQVVNTGAGSAAGGAIHGYSQSFVSLVHTVLHSNTARGGLYTYGGAVIMQSHSDSRFEHTAFVGNTVVGAGTSISVGGGALRLETGARVRMSDSELRNNTATGMSPRGGAIWSAAQSAILVNISLLQNRIVVQSREGFGGAVSVSAGLLRLEGSRVHSNVAESLPGSLSAGAGAIHVSAGVVQIERSSLRGNCMGGQGIAQAVNNVNVGGAHIGSEGGDVIMSSCIIVDDDVSGNEVCLVDVGQWWLAAIQSLALRNCSFRSATPRQGLLRIQGPQLELMIRGSAFENLRIGVSPSSGEKVRPIGVVDSTFAPALDSSVSTVQPTSSSGSCAVPLAGERLCDPRALCLNVPSGGVQCSCNLAGLRYMAGVPEDGRQCEQDAEIRATLQTNVVSITVKKPGVSRDTLRAIIQATGEHPYKIGLNVSVSRLDGSAWPSSRLVVGAVTAVPTNQTSVSAFGQFIEWHNPYPPLYWAADLDNAHFSDTWEQAFHLRLECDNKLDCVADGDILETIVSVKSQQDARLSSRVTILAMVESLMSCENSKAQMTQAGKIVQGSAISAENSLRVRIEAFDVDGYMISRTRAEIEFRCNNDSRGAQAQMSMSPRSHLISCYISASSTW
jgi:hypothetical protein